MSNEGIQTITCSSCGFIDSGRYCSNCGSRLTDEDHGPVLNFIGTFLKFSEIKDFVITFIRILPSRPKQSSHCLKKGTQRRLLNSWGTV